VLPGVHLSTLHLLQVVGVERYVLLGQAAHDFVDALKYRVPLHMGSHVESDTSPLPQIVLYIPGTHGRVVVHFVQLVGEDLYVPSPHVWHVLLLVILKYDLASAHRKSHARLVQLYSPFAGPLVHSLHVESVSLLQIVAY
jgi:hypothetical protein